jgi:demethylmenaquinone methyltransferase / 2-methoxy-6-polyprenyl-1,4-benzoquinol methylase
MSLKVQNLFNGIAPRYDFLNHFLSAGRDIQWRKQAAQLASPFLQKEGKGPDILDLCGGTGDFLAAVLKELPKASQGGMHLIGDFSLNMLRGTGNKFAHLQTQPTRMGVDALHPPFRKHSFDAVFCGYGIRNLDDWRQGVKEIGSLLRPGGLFVTLEFFRPETFFTRFFYSGLAPFAIPFFASQMSRKDAYEYLVSSIRAFSPVSEYARGCAELGFQSVQTIPCDFGITHIVLARKPRTETEP